MNREKKGNGSNIKKKTLNVFIHLKELMMNVTIVTFFLTVHSVEKIKCEKNKVLKKNIYRTHAESNSRP